MQLCGYLREYQHKDAPPGGCASFRNLMSKRTVLWILGVVALVGMLSAQWYFGHWRQRPESKLERLIPEGWVLESASGRIARVCLGGGSECGTLKRRYSIPRVETAMGDLRSNVASEGWHMSEVEHGVGQELTAVVTDLPRGRHTAIVYFTVNLRTSLARVSYVET